MKKRQPKKNLAFGEHVERALNIDILSHTAGHLPQGELMSGVEADFLEAFHRHQPSTQGVNLHFLLVSLVATIRAQGRVQEILTELAVLTAEADKGHLKGPALKENGAARQALITELSYRASGVGTPSPYEKLEQSSRAKKQRLAGVIEAALESGDSDFLRHLADCLDFCDCSSRPLPKAHRAQAAVMTAYQGFKADYPRMVPTDLDVAEHLTPTFLGKREAASTSVKVIVRRACQKMGLALRSKSAPSPR
jgi:hypothetical protein